MARIVRPTIAVHHGTTHHCPSILLIKPKQFQPSNITWFTVQTQIILKIKTHTHDGKLQIVTLPLPPTTCLNPATAATILIDPDLIAVHNHVWREFCGWIGSEIVLVAELLVIYLCMKPLWLGHEREKFSGTSVKREIFWCEDRREKQRKGKLKPK